MRFIHNNKVKLFFLLILILAIQNLMEAPVGYELRFPFNAKQLESLLPVVLECGRVDDKNVRVFPICLDKTLCNHCCNHCLTKTHNVGQKETIVLKEHLVALNHSIFLVL